ncbi:MAG: energy transducer TonB [Proteobacteria bacterium]|nr:energy transducer TonB [Pseudomonadota bacterium]
METAAGHQLYETRVRMALRWSGAVLCVAALHGGTAWAVLNWPKPPVAASQLPAAVMIELAPLPVAPETPPQNVAVGPTQDQQEESTPDDAKEKPVEKTEPTPEPVQEPAKSEPDAKPVEEAKPVETPKLDPVPNAEALLPPPPKPPEPTTEEEKPEPPKEKMVEKTKTKTRPKVTKTQAMAPKAMPLPPAQTNAAPVSGTSSSMSVATWRGMVMAHLERFKRYPGGGGGTSSVAFTIDRAGRVLSARLIRSSGSSTLDQEAAALPRRASPVPPPPANIAGGTVVLTVPVRFH